MQPTDRSKTNDANRFEDIEDLTFQIQKFRRSFFDRPDGTYSHEFAQNVGFIARNCIVDTLQGSQDYLNHGVLTGLVIVQFTKPSIRTGIETRLKKVSPEDGHNPSTQFLYEYIPDQKAVDIDERFRNTFMPTINALAGLYGYDSESAESARARESVVTGFIAGANTIISMCDDWELWTQNMRQQIRR